MGQRFDHGKENPLTFFPRNQKLYLLDLDTLKWEFADCQKDI